MFTLHFEIKYKCKNTLKKESMNDELKTKVNKKDKGYYYIFKELPIGVMLFDLDLNIIEVNNAFFEILNLRKEELSGKSIYTIYDSNILESFKKVSEGNEGFYEGYFKYSNTKNDIFISVHTKPYTHITNDEEIEAGIAIIEDITENKLAINAINKSYDTFQTVTDNINDLIYVIEPESQKVLFMNKKAEGAFGNIVGEKCWKIIGKRSEMPNLELTVTQQAENTNKENVFEEEYYDEGIKRWFRNSFSTIKWIDDKKAILLTSVDITPQKSAELKIKEQNKKLENQTNKYETALLQVTKQNVKINKQTEQLKISGLTKDKMFSIIGHDLRGPVGNIKNALELLIDEFELFSKHEIREFIESVRNSAGSVYNLLANLLYWAKNQSGKMHFDPEFVSLNDIIEENINLFRANFDQKKLKLKYYAHKEFEVFADENMLSTVIRNLISNAVKFTHEDGVITVQVSEIKKDNEISVMVCIEDTGIGIKEENLLKIFNSDEHYSTYGTNNEKGSGLGMILCNEFVEKHGGKIKAESVPNKGSKFSFTIPNIDH